MRTGGWISSSIARARLSRAWLHRCRAARLVAFLVAGPLALLHSPPIAQAASRSCGGKHATTLRRDRQAVVVQTADGPVLGCAQGRRRRTHVPLYDPSDFTTTDIKQLRLTGVYVAWWESDDPTQGCKYQALQCPPGQPSPISTSLFRVNLRTGRRAAIDPGANTAPAALAISSTGIVAWIELDASQTPDTLFVYASAGKQLLDSGGRIDPGSLKLSGNTIRWSKDGQLHAHTVT